jgi:hypothetical protein
MKILTSSFNSLFHVDKEQECEAAGQTTGSCTQSKGNVQGEHPIPTIVASDCPQRNDGANHNIACKKPGPPSSVQNAHKWYCQSQQPGVLAVENYFESICTDKNQNEIICNDKNQNEQVVHSQEISH